MPKLPSKTPWGVESHPTVEAKPMYWENRGDVTPIPAPHYNLGTRLQQAFDRNAPDWLKAPAKVPTGVRTASIMTV